jgi:hypothetical protein
MSYSEADLINMSDDEFESAANAFDPSVEESNDDTNGGSNLIDGSEPQEEELQEELQEDIQKDVQEEEPQEDSEDVIEDTESEETETDEGEPQEPQETAEETADENTQDVTEGNNEINYKTEFEELLAPIKANGSMIEIKSKDDARTLISKGLNYETKMAAIKPLRLAGKTLEKAGIIENGMLNEEALNRMIDFNNGNLDVVKQRLKELEIDPLDLELDEVDYRASNHVVSEQDMVIDDIQRELTERGTAGAVINALESMDAGSKQYFIQNPKDLLAIEQDIQSGAYEKINSVIQYEKSLGRMNNLSDIEAYIQIARSQKAPAQQAQAQSNPNNKVNTSRANTVDKEKRSKAGGSNSSRGNNRAAIINPLDMSDEEFERELGSRQALI